MLERLKERDRGKSLKRISGLDETFVFDESALAHLNKNGTEQQQSSRKGQSKKVEEKERSLRFSDLDLKGPRSSRSSLDGPVSELVQHWMMQDQFSMEADAAKPNRTSVVVEPKRGFSKRLSRNNSKPTQVVVEKKKAPVLIHRSFLTSKNSFREESDEPEEFVFDENIRTLENPWGEMSKEHIQVDGVKKRDTRVPEGKSRRSSVRSSNGSGVPLKTEGIKKPVEDQNKNETGRDARGKAGRESPIEKLRTLAEQPAKQIPKKKPAKKKRGKSRPRSKESSNQEPQLASQAPMRQSRLTRKSSESIASKKSSRSSIGEAPRKQRRTNQPVVPPVDNSKATKKEEKKPGKSGNKQRKTKPKGSQPSEETGLLLSDSLISGEHYHKLEHREQSEQSNPLKCSQAKSIISMQNQSNCSQQSGHWTSTPAFVTHSKPSNILKMPISATSQPSISGMARYHDKPRKVQFVPIEQVQAQQSESHSHSQRYPMRKRFKPLPYWQCARIEHRKGHIIGVSTRNPDLFKRAKPHSSSNLLSQDQYSETHSQALNSQGSSDMESVMGIRSRHKLALKPLNKNLYRLEIPVGDVIKVDEGSFRRVTISVVSCQQNKLWIDCGQGLVKLQAPTTVLFPSGFRVNNRSGSQIAVLQLDIELLEPGF